MPLRTLANRAFLAAKRAPVLLAVEDAHWIDPSTNELLRDIVLRVHGAAVRDGMDPGAAARVGGMDRRRCATGCIGSTLRDRTGSS